MVYRVLVWTEKIKKELVDSINKFENQDVDYYECAMMAEMYRLILFGLYKGNSVDNIQPELFSYAVDELMKMHIQRVE